VGSSGVTARSLPFPEKSWNVSFHEGFPQNFGNEHGKPCLIILDVLLNEVYSKDVCDLFTKGSHHRNMSVILITQNLFHQGRFCHDISLNAKYSVALKNVRDKNRFQYLARQVHPEDSDSLYKSYLEDTDRPHGYLIRFRTRHRRPFEVPNQSLPGRMCAYNLHADE